MNAVGVGVAYGEVALEGECNNHEDGGAHRDLTCKKRFALFSVLQMTKVSKVKIKRMHKQAKKGVAKLEN